MSQGQAVDVAIVGGGIAGLAAAHALAVRAAAGRPVSYLLLEQEDRFGGKVLTEREGGFLFDAGPDCFVTEKPGVIELAGELGIAHRLLASNESHKGTYVLSGGRLHALPEGLLLLVPTRLWPFLASPLISWKGKLRMALDLVLPPRRDGRDESLEEFVLRRLGREALEKIAEPLVAGIHAGDPRTMSVRASFPRFIRMEQEYGSLLRAMLAARRPRGAGAAAAGRSGPGQAAGGTAVPGPRTFFMSFRAGMGELADAVLAALPAERLRARARAARLLRLPEGGEGAARYAVELAGGGRIEARAVILATPSFATAELLQDLDPGLAALVGAIPTVSTAVVHLAYRREDLPPLRGFGVLVPLVEGRRIKAVTYSSIKWDGRVPDPAVVLMRVFVGGARREHLADLGRAELERLAAEEVASLLGFAARPVLARVHRWPRGMHQYVVGHLERLEQIQERLGRHPGLYLAGSAYRGTGTGDCIRSGQAAADAALAFLLKRELPVG